jgi:hypothetical protein
MCRRRAAGTMTREWPAAGSAIPTPSSTRWTPTLFSCNYIGMCRRRDAGTMTREWPAAGSAIPTPSSTRWTPTLFSCNYIDLCLLLCVGRWMLGRWHESGLQPARLSRLLLWQKGRQPNSHRHVGDALAISFLCEKSNFFYASFVALSCWNTCVLTYETYVRHTGQTKPWFLFALVCRKCVSRIRM